MGSYSEPSWEALVAEKQAAVKLGIPAAWKLPAKIIEAQGTSLLNGDGRPALDSFFSKQELDITENHTAVTLLKLMASGIYSSTQVTMAFCKRAAVAQQLTLCLTETFFDQALERAAVLDRYLEKEKKPYGPLHGLPISVKDSFSIKGIQTTLGFASWVKTPPKTQDSALIRILLEAGAVLYVKTNIPTTMMAADCHNNVFGRTLNPHNTQCTPGGSSGGEGALIAFRGSPLGIGTDIAGSIRIPSLCCGLYGFKGTVGRIPYGGQTSPARPGFPGIKACAGPLARSVEDLELLLSVVIQAKPWTFDWTAHAVHWRTLPPLNGQERLTIGIIPEDPKFPLHPSVQRTLNEATAALKAAGHTLVPLALTEAESVDRANFLILQYFLMDPEKTAMKHISASGEPTVPCLSYINEIAAKEVPQLQLSELPEHNARRGDFKRAWLDIFNINKLDVVIGPGAQNTAIPHDTYGLPPYTSLWNFLDYPACVIPYSTVSKEIDAPMKILPPCIGPDFDPILLDGLPCAIQVAAAHGYDEELLRAAKIIDKVLKNLRSTKPWRNPGQEAPEYIE